MIKVLILLVILMFGCSSEKKELEKIAQPIKENLTKEFNFSDFVIEKERFGCIKLGMTIQEAEKCFNGLTKKIEEAENYGICGGGNINVYYQDTNSLFALVPYNETDSIIYILVFNNKFKTSNGLYPNSTVEEIKQKYPNMTVEIDLVTDEEFFYDKKNNWIFSFWTENNNRIGVYSDTEEEPSIPKNTKIKRDCIIIDNQK